MVRAARRALVAFSGFVSDGIHHRTPAATPDLTMPSADAAVRFSLAVFAGFSHNGVIRTPRRYGDDSYPEPVPPAGSLSASALQGPVVCIGALRPAFGDR